MSVDSSGSSPEYSIVRAAALQDIESLQRRYAHNTDRIGWEVDLKPDTPRWAELRAYYAEIFYPDALLRVLDKGEYMYEGHGPEAWLQVASGALTEFRVTQHFIGTQTVEIESLAFDADSLQITSGVARVISHLHANHLRSAAGGTTTDDDQSVRLVVGSYHSEARFDAEHAQQTGNGWRMSAMTLAYATEEWRALGEIEKLSGAFGIQAPGAQQ